MYVHSARQYTAMVVLVIIVIIEMTKMMITITIVATSHSVEIIV